MELYLRACSKAASVAATKTASSSLAADSQQCGDGGHKTHFPGMGASQLLDLPLGVKLPVIPGSDTVFFTTNISEKLFRPSYGFNLTDPYCQLMENQYKNLHDPHLRAYYKRKDILRRLKKGGYITSNNKIVCTLRELNKYRQYLTSLKLDFERNYVREQKMIAKQLRRLQETSHLPECSDVARFQNWLLQEGATRSIKDQERLIRHRYLDMICRELEHLEHTAEEQRLIQRDREERRQREHTRRKLNLRRKIEEEWKTKEMLLLTRIGQDVKREQRVEEQRRKCREESDRKKQALLEKKMAYHLQKMQDTGFKEDMGKNTLENGQDGANASAKKKKTAYDDIKVVYPVAEQKTQKGIHGQTNVLYQSPSNSKNFMKKSASAVYQQDVQDNGTEQKRDGMVTKRLSATDDRGAINISAQGSILSSQPSPTKYYPTTSQTLIGPPKDEKGMNTDWNGRPPKKKSSYVTESGPQARATAPGIFSSPVFSNTQQNLLQNCLQEKVTSEELNRIIQNIMTWVVATVTSILYPAITKYEERLQNNTYPVSDDSVLSSDSSSFCSTCSEEFPYGSYTTATTKPFQAEPCTFAVDTSVRRTNTPLEPPSAQVERRVVGKAYHQKGQSVTPELKSNKASLMFSYPKLGSSKSDSNLVAPFDTGRKKSKDATTETDGLVSPLFSNQKAKAMDEIKKLKNVFVNFKCHLKGETELILESIFQEIMSDLTQAIPSLSSVTAEVFVDQCESEREDLFSSVDICSVASDIVENMLEKLEFAVEKKCVEVFSQEDLSVDIKPILTTSDEYFTSSNGKLSEDSLSYTLEPMCDIAEDMVHAILEKLMTLASYKKNELPLEDKTKLSYQQNKTDTTKTVLQRADREKSSHDPDKTNLIIKEEIQNAISSIFSQSSLVGYVKEAISTILGYVQTELNNERLFASEETIILLKLLDDIFTQLHQKPVKASLQKRRQPRLRNLSDTEEKYRLTGSRLSNGPTFRKPFPPINVPGMVFYSEDDNEEIDNIVKNVLDSSFKEEKAKPQEQIPNHWFTKGNNGFQCKKIKKPPTKSASRSQVAFDDWELKTELPSFSNEDILKETPCLSKNISIFSKDQKHQIQKTSENIVKCILTEMFKDIFSISSGYLSGKIGKESSVLGTEESQGLSQQEWIRKTFSVSEISAVAQEITDSVLNILHKASSYIPNIPESFISSSVHQTLVDNFDSPHKVNKEPNKKPLKIWFDSEKKMKHLSSFDDDSEKPYWSRSRESTPKNIGDISNKIIDTVFKKLKLLVCPKLQMGFKSPLPKQSSLQSQLSTYTTKVVNIVLHAIQNEVEFSKKNLHLRKMDHTHSPPREGFIADTDKKLESLVTDLSVDIMTSPLLTCICEILSSINEDQRNTLFLPDKSTSSTSYGSDHIDKQNTVLPIRQDKNAFRKSLATPCALHSISNGKDLKENNKLQVLDSIGETLQEMLNQLACAYPDSQPSSRQQNREKPNKEQQIATELASNVQFISKTILEYIIASLCSVDTDTNLASVKTSSESIDIDNLSFASIIEEMSKCTSIISDILSRMTQESNKDVTKSKAKNVASVSSKAENSKVTHPNKLKAVASDILNMVFAKLEGFANGNLDTLGVTNSDNQKDSKMDWECASTSAFTDICEEPLQSALYTQAKKVSSALLKAIQTELNMNLSDLGTSVKNPSPETQMLTNVVDLILDAVSTDMFGETEAEDRGIETYHYKPTYGNFLPGGAESESFLEDDAPTEKKCNGERTSVGEEAKTYSKQWILERTLNKIEVKLREPHKSPVVPIIKNILNEIFQSALINELNVLSPFHSQFSDMPHNVHESTTQTSVQFMNKIIGPLVSDTDITVVADDVVRTVFHKLYSAAMTEKNVSENSCKTVTFSANVSFHEHTYGRSSSVAVSDENPCSLQSRFSVDKENKVNVVEDIVQTILTNLEIFTTSKVKSLFYPQVNFTVPVTLPVPHGESTLSKALSAKDSYSDEQFSSCSVDQIKSGQPNSWCQPSLSKLNNYAKEVATKILQGIKHELDKEREGPFLTQKIVVSESIASQVVSTVLDIVSCKSKCDKNSSEKEINSDQQDGIIEKLFNKTEYRKILQFQIQDTIEGILCDIYEKTLFQNNLSFVMPSLKSGITGKYLKANSEIFIEGANKIIPQFSVPKSDVILFSKDIVDIVLHNLNSVVMLGINAKNYTLAQLTFCDTFPKEECHQSLLVGSKSQEKTECFPYSKKKKSAYADDNQIAVGGKEDTKKSVPDPCEENANSITKTIFNRLQSFATERIDSLITLALQPKAKSFVSPELENCKQDDSIFYESSQVESDVNVLKISTTKTILSQELTECTFSSYREKRGCTIHLSEASLKEYADIIASTILKLIKNDLDLEIKKMHPFPNNILFQKNVFVNEIVESTLKILYNKSSVKEISFSSKENRNFSQLTIAKEILLEHKEKEKSTTISLFTNCPIEQNQMTLEKESQKIALEKIFMRNGESKQKEKAELLSAVKDLLNNLDQRIMEVLGQLPPCNETPYFMPNYKIKTSGIAQKNFFQSHINSAANDIVESVLEKMYCVVMTSLYKNKRGEVETCVNNDSLPVKPPCFRETKQVGKRNNAGRCGMLQVYSSSDSQSVSVLESTSLQYSPLHVGKDLIQMVLSIITHFISLHLEESFSPKDCFDELPPVRLCSSKVSPKGSPKQGLKTNLKGRSKISSLPKFKTKPHLGPSAAKAKNKTKLGAGEKTPRDSWSKTVIGLPHILSTGDAKNLLESKLPTSELKMYAKDIISNILESIVKELDRVMETRAMVNTEVSPSDEIMEASKIVNTVLRELYATNNYNLSYPIKLSYQDDLKPSQHDLYARYSAKEQACFYLENVSSQLEQIFPKEGIFKKMFDKWQSESNDMENEKFKLLMTAESVLTEISIKAKDLEYSLSLLNLPPLEDCESQFYNRFKEGSTRAEDTKAQINMFGREIVEILFEKLQLCFLSQMPTSDSKKIPTNRKEHISAKSKHGFPTKHILNSLPVCNMKTKDSVSVGSSNQIVQEIVERVINMLESFVDLQFKHISKYEFSEIVKMPIENLFQVQQRLLSKKILPKLQPLKKISDESKSRTTISKENIQDTLLRVHSFHSELLTYAINIVSDMLGTIKNKLDKEISQVDPSSVLTLKENIVASEIIGTLMDQCTNFKESLIKNLPKESLFQGTENTYIVNQVELAPNVKMPTSKLKENSLRNNPPQSSVPGLVFYSEEDKTKKYRLSSNLPLYVRSSVEDTIERSESVELHSETMPSCSRSKVQYHSTQKPNFGHFVETMKENNSLPEGSVLQKLSKKADDSTEASLKQVMSFIEMGKENPRVFHYETLKPVGEPNQIQTTVSPLKICLAAENIVNTVLSSYGFPNQLHTNESMETIKPFFISKQSSLSEISGEQKNKEKSLLRMWDKNISCIPEEKGRNLDAYREDFSLLQKWENKNPKIDNVITLKEFEVIAFADHELGPNEIHLIARHVTTSVITHLKNFKTRVSTEEEVSLISTLSRKKYESTQPLKSMYNNSAIYQFCEQLTESVICHLTSVISDGTEEGREKDKAREIQSAAFNKIISVHSEMFESRSISVGELALSISEIIIEILSNGNIIEAAIAQQMVSIKTKYIYCPGVASPDLDDFFQDLLTGVIYVLSKEIGINHHFESNGRNNSLSILRSNSGSFCSKSSTIEKQISPRDWESSTHKMDQLVKKNKLNYLAKKLDRLAGSLKTNESKEVVNKVFNIVLDLFLPDEFPDESMDSSKLSSTLFSSPNNQQSNFMLRNNLGLSPKSVFLLNVVCEKLVRTLLEKCTNTVFADDGPLSNEILAEECQLLKILQSEDDEDFDYCKGSISCEQLQGDYMSDLLENLGDMDQDSMSSDSMLASISHSLVKSLMDKLSHSLQPVPESPPFANKHLKHRTREIQSTFCSKAEVPELVKLGQGKDVLGFTSYDSNSLTGSLSSPSVTSSKIQAPFGKQCTVKSSLSPLNRQETKEMDKIAISNKVLQRDLNTGVYSATFLEEIISELFCNLSTSLWEKNANITEAHLNEMNTLLVNNIVNEINAQITVLRNADERLCFPPIDKETVSKIVDLIYYSIVEQYELHVTCGNLVYGNTSIAEQITDSILLEILDYQLPSCHRGKLVPHSYYPLKADIILQKLQNSLRKFTFQPRSPKSYSTMLPHSFLEDVIRRLLSQLSLPSINPSSLEKNYLMSSDFNEMSTCIINKVMSAISKHKIWFTLYDSQHLCTGKKLQKMVDSIYSSILQMSGSLISIQKSIVSRSPIMVDRIASFIIQETIENHLQPFLSGEILPRPGTPLDAVSNMVQQVLSDAVESYGPQKSSSLGVRPDTFVGEIVTRLLSKIFSPKPNTEVELENMTQKIINSVNNHFDKAKIPIPYDNKEQSFPSIDTDIVDELVTSVYRSVLKQHGLDPDTDKESDDSVIFVENITNLIVAAISNYLFHPLFSGDLSASSYSISMAENIVQDILSNISKSIMSSQSVPPYNTLLPYTFLENMIRVLLSRFFPSTSSLVPNRETPKDKSRMNFNEIASNLISDIRMKISQHEIRFSKDEEETKFVYSEDDVQHLVDSVFKNILQNSDSQALVQQNITSGNDVLIDKIAGFIIKFICEQHLQPFVHGKSLPSLSYECFDYEREQVFYTGTYSSTFLEDVVSGVLSKIFHRVVGIVQTKSVADSEDELFDKAEQLIHFIAEEFSKAQVSIIDNAEEQLCLPPVERAAVKNIIDMVYSKVLEDYEVEIMPDKDFLNDTKTLAAKLTKIILTEILDFQIPPNLIANLPFKSHSKLSENVLIQRVQYDISKSRFRRQASTMYTTMLSHTHLEKIVTQLMSQISPSASSLEHTDISQSNLNNTVIKLINEIMSIISKHAICITKHGDIKQSMISEKDIQSMVDSIYADLSHSNLYQSLVKDKKGISNIPVSKIASFIIKEIFNHHLQSFLSGDKTFFSASVDQTYKQKAIDPKQRELSFVVNSAIFLEEVISELLCKIFYAFTHNVLVAENPDRAKAKITNIVTSLVKSIILEFTTSEILVSDYLDENLCSSKEYKEMVQKTVNPIYEKLLDEYKSLIQIYRAIQSDTACFGRKIYHLLLEEIYDYQVQSLVSGELVSSSYSSPRADNIIRNVLSIILKNSSALSSCVTVLPRSLLKDMIYKLLVHMVPSADTENELKEEEVTPDYKSMDTASKLTDDIIKEIYEHEIRLAIAEENSESMQLEAIENFIDSICNNILKKSEFQAEVQKDADQKGGSFLSKIAGFIMKEIMDHHLRPFLYGEESSFSDLPDCDCAPVIAKSCKKKTHSVYSATFLEDVIVDLVNKFCSFPTITEDSSKKEIPESDIVGLAIKFANSLIGEFRKSEIKVIPQAEEIFSFPPIDKETIDNISNFVYDEFIGKYGSKDIQKGDKSSIVIEMIATLAQKAISAFKIQPLFSGEWSSTFFSFLNPDNITQRVQNLSQQTSMQITRCLKEDQLTLPEQSHKHTSQSSNQKNVMGIDRVAVSTKKSFNTSVRKSGIQDPIVSSINAIMKSNLLNLVPVSATGVANKKKEDENKLGSHTKEHSENISKVTSPSTTVKRKQAQDPDISKTIKDNEIERKKKSTAKNEQQGTKVLSVATDNTEYDKYILGSDFETDNEKSSDKNRERSIEKVDKHPQLPSFKSRAKSMETITDKTLKVAQKPNNKERRHSLTQIDVDEIPYSDYECVQNVIENIYENVLEMSSSQEPLDLSKPRNSKSSPGDKVLNTVQEVGKDSAQSAITKGLSLSINEKVLDKEKEKKEREKVKEGEKEKEYEKKREREHANQKTFEIKLNKPDQVHLPRRERVIFPANFLEDVITEIVNILIFSSSPETQICDRCLNAHDDQNQAELYETAMKLIDSLLKEFSDAQIKVFRPNKGNQFLPHADKISSVPTGLRKCKEPTIDEASPSIKTKNVNKVSRMHKMTEKASSDKIPFLDKIQSIDKTLVNKVVHSSVCSILKENRSRESICKKINSNRENLARNLTSAVISEIFQHQLHLLFCDEVPDSACLPLESKDVVKKVQKVVQTASKECQTSSPYTIMLPHRFLEDVISALLSKIFNFQSVSNSKNKAKTSGENSSTELDFLQMKLVSTVAAEISKNEDMVIRYVESLHPNDDEIIQLVVQSIYNNLLPQFGSREVIQNCVTSGCRLLLETIVDLVLREVAGNQLQNYFCGELTPHQCAEVDSAVENILKDIIQTAPPQPSQAHKLCYNVIEEIAVKFLSKLLSVFPKIDKEQTRSLENEMQNITLKILKSFQEFMSKSKIKLVSPAKESPTVPLADNATIEKVVNSVYTNVLKHSGSHKSVFTDLMGKSNVLSDIIGFLMVKEISNSEFEPQVEEEVSNSELALEAVQIMEKVVKIIEELKSQEKPSSIKGSMLHVKVLEEALALFLAKLIGLPSVSSKDTNNLEKPKLNKVASQLTKCVTAEISRSNISLVAADPEEHSLEPENMEMISQVIDSVYSNIFKQCGTDKEFYDIKGANLVFPKKVASLIIDGISRVPSESIISKNPKPHVFGELDIERIIEKARKHAIKILPELDVEEAGEENPPVKIVPCIGKKPIKIDPEIVSEHLTVLSVKTQPIEKLKMECLRRTGHSIAELRRASISGKSCSSTESINSEKRKKERRTSLNRMGRLDVKPFEAVGRNSFQNIRKPDITTVELLKDVQTSKDLIIRLVAHDINQEHPGNYIAEEGISDEDEIVLGEVVVQGSLGGLSEDQERESGKPVESKVAFSKTIISATNLKKFLAISKCCQTTNGVNIESMEEISNLTLESKDTQVKRVTAELDMPFSKTLTETDSSRQKKTQHKNEEKSLVTEPTHYYIHRIMSTSSYNQDLISTTSEAEDFNPYPMCKVLKESHQEQKPENSNSIKFITIFEGSKNAAYSAYPSKEIISETPKSNIPKQGSKMLAKVSSALSKVFSRSNSNIPKSSSPPHRDEH
ncbi:fibrous sheath-interacting protein 2 [Sciurus carolinensis]|uniref:fibrous sheath-interacting protein 2 n=1 Tax=Sciurus carolinensis TaxID=30640 RepID=UPI001FB2E8FF|nr:fibrous sheath-interacting protein 2 [Sciurus carolinensis]